MTIEEITQQALLLPREARGALADRLVESLDPAEEGPFREAWAKEALRRVEEVRSGKVKTIPGPEVIEEARRRLKG